MYIKSIAALYMDRIVYPNSALFLAVLCVTFVLFPKSSLYFNKTFIGNTYISANHSDTAYWNQAAFTNINIMIMIAIFFVSVVRLRLLLTPSAERLFKHDSKFAWSLCCRLAPADCCFHIIKPEWLLRTCYVCFYASAFPPTHEGRFCNSLLFCCDFSESKKIESGTTYLLKTHTYNVNLKWTVKNVLPSFSSA